MARGSASLISTAESPFSPFSFPFARTSQGYPKIEKPDFLLPPPPIVPEVGHQPVAELARKVYLGYSMYVTLDRSLPHVADESD